ncbi:MAG: ABC transporter ATP-binding protein, partial [Luminiphilus sp.]|nr:ABC transporter ATP-binding protein [Luminiphilus sp.]
HDRDFMDKVVTSLLVIDDHGVVDEQAGGFSDWEARGGGLQRLALENRISGSPSSMTDPKTARQSQQRSARKLTYKERRELDQLPTQIEALEADHLRLMALTETTDFYIRDSHEVNQTLTELAKTADQLDAALERLIELEDSAS